MPADLTSEQWAILRHAVTTHVLGAMNLALARSSDPECELADLRAMWAYGLFDPADGSISHAFLERCLSHLLAHDASLTDGVPAPPDELPVTVEQMLDLVRRHLPYPLS